MTCRPVVIAGIGILSPIGNGVEETLSAIANGRRGIRPLSLFGVGSGQAPLPVGQVALPGGGAGLPRTHRMALAAARQALTGQEQPPDAVVLGVTTGGMLTTEERLREGASDPVDFRYHAPGSVADWVAQRLGCRGPVLTVSTACSSGAVAIALALEMIRSGRAHRVLAGGADALCRLTYHGFNSLQVVDPEGARPLDRHRAGMSVGEGAAFLLIVSDGGSVRHPIAQISGAGLSCDAYHPAAPHPEGRGARDAMTAAIRAAGMSPDQIGCVNLHGTGTRDNDLAEARALHRVFGKRLPPLSSVKGATGHGLAASGAIEAVISALTVSRGLIPGTPGFRQADPELGLTPVTTARLHPVTSVLSNSLGFGGNNAALVISASSGPGRPMAPTRPPALTVLASACLSGAGGTARTLACLQRGDACCGVYPTDSLSQGLGHHTVRRLRRLPRMALALAADACSGKGPATVARAVFFGTGWGALSETHNFLEMLFQSGERFSSPTDFIGSVHNAPAGQVALNSGATGANLTLTAGDASFEQALYSAALLSATAEGSLLVMGADEYHPVLSARFDPSVAVGGMAADGGGAFCLSADEQAIGPKIETVFLGSPGGEKASVGHLIEALGGVEAVREGFGAVLAGIPAAMRRVGLDLLDDFRAASRFGGPIVDYRKLTGEFATASALAAAAAVHWKAAGRVPGALCDGRSIALGGKGILLIGFGEVLTAVTIGNRNQDPGSGVFGQ